jgi:hypothetical protein
LQPILRTTGRLIGMLAGGITAALWVYLIWIPIGDFMLDSVIGVVVGGLMGLFGLVAAIAAYHGHATVLFFCFVGSFFGVGAFALNVDNWFRIFGILDLLLLLASVMIWYSARGEERTQ